MRAEACSRQQWLLAQVDRKKKAPSVIPYERSSAYAWRNVKRIIADEMADGGARDLIELGAGRHPFFKREEVPAGVATYTLNDIDPQELELAPADYDKAVFDVCGELDRYEGRFDFAFSRMLAEHVPDGRIFHRNVCRMLRPGGRAFHFMPILYSPPFVINRLLPEALAEKLLLMIVPYRTRDRFPKFPARYSRCRAKSKRLLAMYREVGFADVDIEVFFGNDYFNNIPVLNKLDALLSEIAYRRDFEHLAAYAFVRARKALARTP